MSEVSEIVIRTENLSKRFHHENALDQISIAINRNDCLGIVGRNGAGKSTLLKIILGLLEQSSGTVYYEGDMSLSQNFKRKVGFFLGKEFLLEELSGRQYLQFLNLIYNSKSNRKTKEQIEELFQYFFDSFDSIDKNISTYSFGMMQKIGICGSLIHEPKLLFLDEPFTGLDTFGSQLLSEFLNNYRLKNTVIISSHDLHFVEKICTTLLVIDEGKVKYYDEMTKFTEGGIHSLEKSLLDLLAYKSRNDRKLGWLV